MIKHQKQWQFLTKSAQLGKLPHALLFCGQEKLGKKDLAVKFARFLIGGNIERGVHPDFILIKPEGKEIQISQIRELLKKLSFKPYSADLKVAVIDQAHLMTQEAQSCFLKFLEEPKAKTFLILITSYPLLLLPTIVSRVQKIRFFPGNGHKTEEDQEIISNLIKLSQADLSCRFQFAKDTSAEKLKEILETWLRYFRKLFISRLSGEKIKDFNYYSLTKIKDVIKRIQSLNFLLATTNINPRLALEILLMEL